MTTPVGAIVSIVHVRLAGVLSVLPIASVARTWKVCDPFVNPEYAFGEVQALKAAPSRLQVKVEPVSVAVKLKLAAVLATVPDGPTVMVVSGARISIVQVRLAGVLSTLTAASVARTWQT